MGKGIGNRHGYLPPPKGSSLPLPPSMTAEGDLLAVTSRASRRQGLGLHGLLRPLNLHRPKTLPRNDPQNKTSSTGVNPSKGHDNPRHRIWSPDTDAQLSGSQQRLN
jgi:hypothetical protein